MLRAAFPEAHLTVCDLDRDKVDFCAAQFNATPVYSQEDIRSVSLDQTFDLIWCGSLFTSWTASAGRPLLLFRRPSVAGWRAHLHYPWAGGDSVDARKESLATA
jgi:hypothetical protein